MPDNSTALATTPAPSVAPAFVKSSTRLGAFLGMDTAMMLDTLKVQCFKGKRPDEVSDEQLAAFVSVAAVLELNPLVPGMLYAYPERNGGITPIIGPDGVFKKLSELKGVSYKCTVYPEDPTARPTHAQALIYVDGKDQSHEYTARMNEWYQDSNPNWKARPAHMIWIRALKQCARQVIHGLPMDEEERHISHIENVTGTGAGETPGAAARAEVPKRAAGVAGAKVAAAAPKGEDKPDPKPVAIPTAPAAAAAPAKIVEAEFTDIPADIESKPRPAAPAPVVVAPPPAAKPASIVMKKGELVTVEGVTVETITVKSINAVANSVEAEVVGAYTGKVYHLGGAGPAWQKDSPVTLQLRGRELKNLAIIAMVESIELTEAV